MKRWTIIFRGKLCSPAFLNTRNQKRHLKRCADSESGAVLNFITPIYRHIRTNMWHELVCMSILVITQPYSVQDIEDVGSVNDSRVLLVSMHLFLDMIGEHFYIYFPE